MRRIQILGLLGLLIFCGYVVSTASGIRPMDVFHKIAALVHQEEAREEPADAYASEEPSSDVLRQVALGQTDPELAKAAVYALAELLDESEASVLLEIVRNARHIEVRKAAVYALGNIDGDTAVPLLQAVIESEVSTEIKKAAVHALGNIGTPKAREALIEVLEDRVST